MEWFKHDIGSYRSDQIQALRISSGSEAVDVYYALIEELYENEGSLTLEENQVKTKCFLFALRLVFTRFLELLESIEDAELLEVSRVEKDGETVSVTVSSRRVSRTIESMKELSKIRSQSGKMGGRPRNQETKAKANGKQTETKAKANAPKTIKTIKTNKKDVSKDTSKKPATVKRSYGENGNVLLTDDELSKLQERFPDDWQQRIDDLSFYIGSTGKTYKSHYLTILNWERKNQPKGVSGNAIADKYRDFEKRNPPRRVTY